MTTPRHGIRILFDDTSLPPLYIDMWETPDVTMKMADAIASRECKVYYVEQTVSEGIRLAGDTSEQ